MYLTQCLSHDVGRGRGLAVAPSPSLGLRQVEVIFQLSDHLLNRWSTCYFVSEVDEGGLRLLHRVGVLVVNHGSLQQKAK